MKQFTIDEIKLFLNKQANECGYTFSNDNPPYQNITRLEALRAHYNMLLEEMNCLHPVLKISDANKKEIENWIEGLEKHYVKKEAPKVGKLSGALIKQSALTNEAQL